MYTICNQNKEVFQIEMGRENKGLVRLFDDAYMPFDIYLEEGDDIDTRINNISNFNCWCAGRILNFDRMYAKEILNYFGYTQRLTDADRASIAIATRCLSLNDNYWLKFEDEDVHWEDVNLFQNSLEHCIFEIALTGKTPTITNTEHVNPDITTDGKSPKAWLRDGNTFYLLKGGVNDSVRKEVEASQILTQLGIKNTGYEQTFFDGKKVSKCKCFTNDHISLVRAEWFHIWCMNHDEDIADYIWKYKESFDKMNLADYLIGNNDEHPQNWGFLYDGDRNILGMNPLMDYDHAFESQDNSVCLPARFLGIQITQKEMALQVLGSHPEYIRMDVDLSGFHYGSFVQERIDNLMMELN